MSYLMKCFPGKDVASWRVPATLDWEHCSTRVRSGPRQATVLI